MEHDQQMSWVVVRYLGKVVEALNYYQMTHGQGYRAAEFFHTSFNLADHIEHIAQFEISQNNLEFRAERLVRALNDLVQAREHYAEQLQRVTLHVPSAAEINKLLAEVTALTI